ncbi:hypothetical protein Nepgr_007745 [Nepenthes gracilis]|uniref:Chloride channel protein n=1 Tax=Nepenthes gracilis TaxID=150966 RepID=A0AAD3S7F0_NEPGR|nr:hypothetical protein Nepgr_007745 [Nepenthes gracilis]
MSGGNENGDLDHLLRSNALDSVARLEEGEEEHRRQQSQGRGGVINNGIKDLIFSLKRLDRGSSGSHRHSISRERDRRWGRIEDEELSSTDHYDHSNYGDVSHTGGEAIGDSAPPEWALLLVGCLLGLATGLCVAAFNRGVHLIHEWAWAGTPNEGAAWLRLQRLADTWHRILLIPVTGGVIVGMMHGLLEILDQIKPSSSLQRQGLDLLSGVFPTIKAIQAAVTLGTGCSLGPEGPSVDIGKSCARGCSIMMENNRERKIALVAAGAAAGIASGFNAAVAGCFFAIETVLRPHRAENSPPFTTAMIILASVISSTVSNELLSDKSAFTVPAYDLKSAAELPLYLILGMLCGVVSVVFTRLVVWFTKLFEFIKERFSLPAVVCPALGGLGAGIIALKYPGTLYWGFTNVDEILHTGKSASAPGIWLLAQLAASKVVATALCKGSGLVGGLYAPSLMIGAAVGAVFGGSAAELINLAIPGNAAVAQPQAYALVGMAATLAAVCSVPLTSVLLLFELTKDYRILLPLMGAVGLAIWVPSIANQGNETEVSDTRGYSFVSHGEDKETIYGGPGDGDHLELSVIRNDAGHAPMDEDILEDLKVSHLMSKNFLKMGLTITLKEAIKCMHESRHNCVLVVDEEDLLEGILTYGDIKWCLSQKDDDAPGNESSLQDVYACPISSFCTRGISYRGQERGILTCYPDTELAIAKDLMEAKGINQLPVVKRGGKSQRERRRRIVAILNYDSISNFMREVSHQRGVHHHQEDNPEEIVANSHSAC